MTVPFDPTTIRTDTGKIVVRVARSAEQRLPPVIGVHGFGVTGELTFRDVVRDLNAAGADVFVPEMPEPEKTDSAAPSASIHLHASIVARVARGLTNRAPVLVGHSMGGKTVLGTAVLYPGLVQGVVLVNTGGFSVYASWLPHLASLRLWGRILRSEKLSEAVISYTPLRRVIDGGRGRRHLLHLNNSHFELDLDHAAILSRLREIGVPTLLIWGVDDPILPRSTPQRFLDAVPGASVQYIKDAGHTPMKDQPDEFVRTLLNFMELELAGRIV